MSTIPPRYRWIIIFIAALAILFALAAYGYFTGRWEDDDNNLHIFGLASAQTRPELCMDEESREQVRRIMLEALDSSLRTHIEHMFEVWMKDEHGQPARAATGVRQGVRAWTGARRSTLEWNPPACR